MFFLLDLSAKFLVSKVFHIFLNLTIRKDDGVLLCLSLCKIIKVKVSPSNPDVFQTLRIQAPGGKRGPREG
jgi:hypothetical protein